MGSLGATESSASLRAAGGTHPGRRRELNEDAFLIQERESLYLVADGVGGHDAGEVASNMALLSMQNFFEVTGVGEKWPDSYRSLLDLTLSPAAQRLAAAVRKANADVHQMAELRSNKKNMNTTVVAAHYERRESGSVLHVAHVGDSRLYRIRDNKIQLLTRDHSLRNEAILRKPNITRQQLRKIPKNVITRALGRAATVELEIQSIALQPDDAFVLCSDGVNRMIRDVRILEAMLLVDDPHEAVGLLISLANDAGGIDNITAIVLAFNQ